MNRKTFYRNILIIILSAALFSALLCGCKANNQDSHDAVKSCEDLNGSGYVIGAMNGTIDGQIAQEVLSGIEVVYYNSNIDLITALETGKIDAVVGDDMTWIYYNNETGGKLRILDGYLKPFEFGYIFSKTDDGRALCNSLSSYIDELNSNGTLAEINSNWMDADGARKMAVDYTKLPATNGTIRMATTGDGPPFTYMEDGTIIGFDIDIVSRYCQEYGYGLEVITTNFDGLIPYVLSGRCDIGGAALTITEERAKSVEFSSPYYFGGTAVALYNTDYASASGLLGRLKDSFSKTFIAESRYKLFLKGILNTLLITILSAFFGTLIGFAVYMLCRKGNRVANVITNVCVRTIQMLPVVVLLMILFYIVFASADVTGVFVSICAFSLTFGASVFGMLTSSVSAINKGQTEAAYALGFSDRRTFFKIVLPQAMPIFLSSFKSELVSLIKATAVVGYIAVQDLTRTGDIVRSRTYEAFFPLISVAVIYFLLAWLLIVLADRIEIGINPKRRKREDILKGIRTE